MNFIRPAISTIIAIFVMAAIPHHSYCKDLKTATPDSVLFDMTMRLYDSLTTDSFFKMYNEALHKSQAAKNEKSYITTRRMLISRYAVLKDVDAFISESDKVIRECQRSETDMGQTLLYDTWNFKADRLDSWGMKEDAIRTAKEMVEYAERHQHMKGLATAQYVYGGFYLNAHQLDEAERCLNKAWNICKAEGYREVMANVGLSRLAVLIDKNRFEDGLAVADSVRSILDYRESIGKKVAPATRAKLAGRLCTIYYMLGESTKAEAQRDSMMMWYKKGPDRSLLMTVLHTDAACKYYSGKYLEAIPVFDSLIHIAERRHNWGQVANNMYALALSQENAGLTNEAIESYKRYVEAKDSAIVQDSRAQLDELTKKCELAELDLAAKKARSRKNMATGAVAFLLLVVGFYFFYAKRLLEKNKILFEKVNQSDAKTIEAVRLTVKESDTPLAKIFVTVNELMSGQKIFKDADLNRESLAIAAGTNKRYLADAVKEFSGGKTVNEFINWWRLQEASKMLSEDVEIPLAVVGREAGFGSIQTFYRLFKEHFGMTPADYRNMAFRTAGKHFLQK